MKEDLTKEQKELLEFFYSKDKAKVLYVKRERNKLWKAVTGRESIAAECLAQIQRTCPAIICEIQKSKASGKNIQSAVFSECVYAQTLAGMFGLKFVQNFKADDIPDDVQKFLNAHCMHVRYCYADERNTVFLFQAGSKNCVDCCLCVKDKNKFKYYMIEFKETSAKAGEFDLPLYGEDGILVVDEEIIANYPHFIPMFEEKSGLNFFEVMGSNINNFCADNVKSAADRSYVLHHADVIVTEDKNGCLVMLPADQISRWAAKITGEIRPVGRNPHKVWTPIKAKEIIEQKGGKIENGMVTIEKSKLIVRKSRGNKTRISAYKPAPVFYVEIEKCTDNGSCICFNFDDLQQSKPSISVKINFRGCCYEAIKSAYMN